MTKHIPMTPPESAEINERLDELKAAGATKIRVIFKLYQNFEWQLGIHEDGAMHPRVHHILIGDETLQDFDDEYPIDEANGDKIEDDSVEHFDLLYFGDTEEEKNLAIAKLPEDYAQDGSPIFAKPHCSIRVTADDEMLAKFNVDEAQYGKAYKQENGLYHIYFDSIEAFQHAVKSTDQ
jgi:hypothetical protein